MMKSLFFTLILLSCAVNQLPAQTFLMAQVPERRQVGAGGGSLVLWLEPGKLYPVIDWMPDNAPLLKTNYGNAIGSFQDKFKMVAGGSFDSSKLVKLSEEKVSTPDIRSFTYKAILVSPPKNVYAILQVYADGKPYKNTVRCPYGLGRLWLNVDISSFPFGKKLTYDVHFYTGNRELRTQMMEN